MLRVDAHHHLWQYSAVEYPWIDDRMKTLRQNFLMDDLLPEIARTGVDLTVVVQARQSLEETQWLLEAASKSERIAGVVGWVQLSDTDVRKQLERFAKQKKFAGCRHVLQAEPDGFMEAKAFNSGLRHVTDLGLTYDILITHRQMGEAIRLVDRHPKQQFTLDHLGKPSIASGELQPWRQQLAELAQRENVFCKLSGMVTEANWERWDLAALRPYLDAAVESFGTKRLMAGSDWPVCLLACGYSKWWSLLEEYFSSFNETEREDIFGGNAVRFYGLTPDDSGSSSSGDKP